MGESKVDMTLSCERERREELLTKRVSLDQEADQDNGITKMAGLYEKGSWRKGFPAPGLGKFRVRGKTCQPYPVTGRD